MTAPAHAKIKDKRVRALLERAIDQGFTVRAQGNGHLAVHRPCGAWATTIGTTISDCKAYLLIRSQLRRAGYRGL